MSTIDEEARALERAAQFLRDIGSGVHPLRPIKEVRAEARSILRHYPMIPGIRWTEAHDD